MRFKKVAEAFKEIENASGQIKMIKIMSDLLKYSDEIGTVSLYLVGQIYPGYSQEKIRMGDKMIQAALAKASGLEEESVEQIVREKGDLGDAAAGLDIKTTGNPSVKDVDKSLKRIGGSSGEGSENIKIDTFANLLKKATPIERKYITRLANGTMRLGAGDMTVLDALALGFLGSKDKRDVLEHAYNMCSDIAHVAEVLQESGLEGVKKIRIAINRPLKPMLAQRVSRISKIKEHIVSDVSVEEKYDGQRIQAHKSGDEVKLFSRRLTNITEQFPDVVEQVKKIDADKAVLDGEVVAYDFGNESYHSFQKLMHRRRKYDIEEYADKIPVKYIVFDLLYLEGRSLLKNKLKERRDKLKKVVNETKYMALAGRVVTDQTDKIEDFFNKCMERELEGVVCKDVLSEYEAGARGWAWIKWKKDYAEELSDTFDLTVVGAYAGKGKRSGLYGSLLCATYNKKNDVFETVTKLGAGFTDKDLEEIPQKLEQYKTQGRPARVKAKLMPDYWFQPGVVLEVVASEITKSPVHTCSKKGLALRFPRFKKWRDDKRAEQSTKSKAIWEVFEK